MTVTGKMFGSDVIENEGQNKILYFHTVQFVSTLNKALYVLITLCTVSHTIRNSITHTI